MASFKNNDYIDLIDIAKKLWIYKIPIIALAVVMAVLSAVRVEFFVEDLFVSNGKLYVSSFNEDEENAEVSEGDIKTAISMSATYIEILKTRDFLQEVANDLNENNPKLDENGDVIEKYYTWGRISSMMSVGTVNETEIIKISVVTNSAKESYFVEETILKKAPEVLGQVFPNGTISVIENANIPGGPVGKGVTGSAVKGFLLGMVIAIAAVVVINLFDTKIHKSEDVAKRYGVSILGEINQ